MEIDSKVVFDWLSKPTNCYLKHSTLIWNCHNLLQRNWEVQLNFIFRERNIVADCLAKNGLELSLGDYLSWSQSPHFVEEFLHQDMLGLRWP